jgi:hypothetical protein
MMTPVVACGRDDELLGLLEHLGVRIVRLGGLVGREVLISGGEAERCVDQQSADEGEGRRELVLG